MQNIKFTKMENTFQHKVTECHGELKRAVSHLNSERGWTSIEVTPFRITTITLMILSESSAPFNLQMFYHWCEQTGIDDFLTDSYGGEWYLKSLGKFYNCIIFSHSINIQNKQKKVAVKLFLNGKLHITGLQEISQTEEYANIMSDIIHMYFQSHIPSPTKYVASKFQPSDFCVQLINGCCKIVDPSLEVGTSQVTSLNLKELFVFLVPKISKDGVSVLYNNEHHPGIRIKIRNESNGKVNVCTIMIFKSGSILINSFVSGKQLVDADALLFPLVDAFFCYQRSLCSCTNRNDLKITEISEDSKTKVSKTIRKRKRFDYSQYI